MGQMLDNSATPPAYTPEAARGTGVIHVVWSMTLFLKLWPHFLQIALPWFNAVTWWHPGQFRNGRERQFLFPFQATHPCQCSRVLHYTSMFSWEMLSFPQQPQSGAFRWHVFVGRYNPPWEPHQSTTMIIRPGWEEAAPSFYNPTRCLHGNQLNVHTLL